MYYFGFNFSNQFFRYFFSIDNHFKNNPGANISKIKFLKNIKIKINITGEISIEPKLGKNLLIKFKGGAVSL